MAFNNSHMLIYNKKEIKVSKPTIVAFVIMLWMLRLSNLIELSGFQRKIFVFILLRIPTTVPTIVSFKITFQMKRHPTMVDLYGFQKGSLVIIPLIPPIQTTITALLAGHKMFCLYL